jgi:hypothetical protein
MKGATAERREGRKGEVMRLSLILQIHVAAARDTLSLVQPLRREKREGANV